MVAVVWVLDLFMVVLLVYCGFAWLFVVCGFGWVLGLGICCGCGVSCDLGVCGVGMVCSVGVDLRCGAGGCRGFGWLVLCWF